MNSSQVTMEGQPETIVKKENRRHIVTLQCPFCDKVFSGDASFSGVRSNYRRHLLIHTHERPYSCVFCGDGFTTRQNMKRHVRLCHPLLASPAMTVQSAPACEKQQSSTNFHDERVTNIEHSGANHIKLIEEGNNELHKTHENLEKNDTCINVEQLEPITLPESTQRLNVERNVYSNNCSNNIEKNKQTSNKLTALLPKYYCEEEEEEKLSAYEIAETVRPLPDTHNNNHNNNNNNNNNNSSSISNISRSDLYNLNTSLELSENSNVNKQKTPLKVSFTCVDCEAELSSKSKLRRHMRFHCPFRDNVETDFVADLIRYKNKEVGPTFRSSLDEITCSAKNKTLSNKNAITSNNKVVNKKQNITYKQWQRNPFSKEEEEQEELEEEEQELRRIAEQTGMNYYANANDSEDETTEEEEEEEEELEEEEEQHRETMNNLRGLEWGKIMFANCKSAYHKYHENYNNNENNYDSNDDEDNEKVVVHEELHRLQKLHLAYHRRRSGHKRQRRILRKRLRAQEQRIVFTPTENINQTHLICKATLHHSVETPLLHRHDNTHKEHYAQVSDSLYHSAVAIAQASQRGNMRDNTSTFVCPFDSCEKSFAKRKNWLAHVARCHQAQYAEMRKNDVHTAEEANVQNFTT